MTEQEKNLDPLKRKAYLIALRDLLAEKNPSFNGFELWWDMTTASEEDRIEATNLVFQNEDKAAKVLEGIAENVEQYAASKEN